MINYTEKDFSDLMYETLDTLGYEQTLQNPTTESVFPCIELHNPLKNVLKTQNAFPIKTMFQFSTTCWNELPRSCMNMANEVEETLQKYNLVRTNTSSILYNQILKKYSLTITFEVNYNAITHAFEFIK